MQRIGNAWDSKALFQYFPDLSSSPITVDRSRLSWCCIFLGMTHLPDARMDDDADQALKSTDFRSNSAKTPSMLDRIPTSLTSFACTWSLLSIAGISSMWSLIAFTVVCRRLTSRLLARATDTDRLVQDTSWEKCVAT